MVVRDLPASKRSRGRLEVGEAVRPQNSS